MLALLFLLSELHSQGLTGQAGCIEGATPPSILPFTPLPPAPRASNHTTQTTEPLSSSSVCLI